MRVAILGCGRIARLVHLRLFVGLAGVTVTALADPDAEALAAAKKLAPGAQGFADWRDALAAGVADAAIIVLPPALHASAAIAAFGAGLHVYVEKPLALDLAEGDAMLSAQAQAGKIGQIGLNFRHNPLYQGLQQRLAAGEAGQIIAMRMTMTSARRALPAWKTARGSGGGVLRDLGVHHLDLAEYLTGCTIARLSCIERNVETEADVAMVRAETASGIGIDILVSSATGHSVNRVEIFGSKGHLTVDTGDAGPRVMEPVPGSPRVRAARAAVAALNPMAVLRTTGGEASFGRAFAEFAGACAAGRDATPDLVIGQRALRLVLAAEAAAMGGAVIETG